MARSTHTPAVAVAVAAAIALGVKTFVAQPARLQSDTAAPAGLTQSPLPPTTKGEHTGFACFCLAAVGVAAATFTTARSIGVGAAKRRPTQTSVVVRAFENELGVQPPVGFWDPLGFTAEGNAEDFARRRQTEIKHGRVSMLACMGYITPELTGKLPGYLSPSMGLKFADIPNGLGAISKVPLAGWGQILAYGAFCELSQDQSPGTPGAKGDFGFKVLTSSDPEEKTKKLAAEIANGRLAMMAIIGMFFQDGLTGSAWGDWSLYTASPLRAFESETGVQPPVGFWDPLGFTADGSQVDFARRRSVELKHGRISMLACIGYIVPELSGKFPGYLSPSLGLRFEDIPNGLGAISKVPGLGWLQIVFTLGFYEVILYVDQKNDEPGNFGAGFLGANSIGITASKISDPEVRKKKLNAELANGRLAMMAIIGMFFQDGLTGSAWGDWSLYTDSPLRAFENVREYR